MVAVAVAVLVNVNEGIGVDLMTGEQPYKMRMAQTIEDLFQVSASAAELEDLFPVSAPADVAA